jgi:hypothetical protein
MRRTKRYRIWTTRDERPEARQAGGATRAADRREAAECANGERAVDRRETAGWASGDLREPRAEASREQGSASKRASGYAASPPSLAVGFKSP